MNLKPHIGSEKTLVITDTEFHASGNIGIADKVSVYNIPKGLLFRYDRQQQEMLRYHIYERGCTLIIYIGTQQPVWLDAAGNDESIQSLDQLLKFNLSVLLRHQKDNILKPAIRSQMLSEFHVITQCKLLLDYFFIRKKVENCDLQLKGVITELNSQYFKSIFCNGISYNDLLTLN